MNIFFGDLFHKRNFPANVVPLNVGYLANALKVTFGDSLDIRIFKYLDKLLSVLDSYEPDIICLSNFIWNQRLSLWLARYAKKRFSNILVIMGGPNVRHDQKGLKNFLDQNPAVDAYIPLSGELPLIDLIRALLEKGRGDSVQAVYKKIGNLPGVYLNVPGYSYTPYDPRLFENSLKFGSPYLSGILDEFVSDKGLSPIFETNRGCPYSCTYCSWGVTALSRIYKKDLDIVKKEFDYVVKNGAGQKNWITADANFGMFPRDLEIARMLKAIHDEHGYPLQVDVNWAKSSAAELVIEMTKLLGDMISPQIAVQSLDKNVLKHIKRTNLSDPDIIKLINIFHTEQMGVHTDILTGLSNETFQSNKYSLGHAYELGFDHPSARSVILLPGSENDSDESRKKYGLITKFRRLSDSFGEYLGEFVFEIEETVVGSKDLSESEFLDLRELHFLNFALWSSGIARGFLKLGMKLGIPPLDVMEYLQKKSRNARFMSLLADLRADIEKEQFDSIEALEVHTRKPETRELILKGGMHDKMMWKYLARLLVERGLVQELLEDITQYIGSRTDARTSLLDLASKISLDVMKLDFTHETHLVKHVEYVASQADFEYLVKSNFLAEGLLYKDGILYVTYQYSEGLHVYFKELLEKFNFQNRPKDAYYSTLHYNLLEHMTYSMVNNVPKAGSNKMPQKQTAKTR